MKRTAINNPENFDPTHGPRIGTGAVTKQIGQCAASLVVFLIAAVEVQAGGVPQIDGLSDATLARSGRLLIFGTNFGGRQGEVLIDGLSAIATTWTDTEIHAYVPEAATLGSVPVRVTTARGTSDAVTLNVTMRPSGGASSGGQNRIRWRFQLDSQFSGQFITVAPDGTVYATDLFRLYALSPDGGLLWVAVNAGRRRPISLGPDGTIYTAGNLIKAINPDGTMKWEYSSPFGSELLAGPSVGPDGNIYAVQNTWGTGLGAFALDPDGELLFSDPDNLLMASNADSNSAIVFRPDMFYVGIRVSATAQPVLNAFDFDGDHLWSGVHSDRDLHTQTFPKLDPSGRVIARWAQTGMMAITPNGDVDWVSIHPGGGMPTMPGIDATGVIYTGTYLGRKLWAIDPNGSTRWVLLSSGGLTDTVNVAPDGSIILVGGSDTFGQPGWAQAYDTADGTFLWQVDLLSEGGINQYVCSQQPTFTPDSRTAYATTCFLGNVAGYVYALRIGDEVEPTTGDLDGDGEVGPFDLALLLGSWGPCGDCEDCPADLDGDCRVGAADLAILLGNWG
ncbi:MAG: hypothetical protein IID34_05330 [Planctomycetes bacterium]|nr:hypothetical protein [Planctomycetota bacterium]